MTNRINRTNRTTYTNSTDNLPVDVVLNGYIDLDWAQEDEESFESLAKQVDIPEFSLIDEYQEALSDEDCAICLKKTQWEGAIND